MNAKTKLAAFSANLSLISSKMSIKPNNCSFASINGDFNFHSIVNIFYDPNCLQHSMGWTAFLIAFSIIIFLLGLLGNGSVVYLVPGKSDWRTPTNFFLFSLAMADLLVTPCCLPAYLSSNLFIPWTPLGEFWCKVAPYIQAVSLTASAYSILAVYVERCLAILNPTPTKKYFTVCQSFLIIIAIWIFSPLINLPWHNNFHHEAGQLPFCHETWPSSQHEQLRYLLVNFLISYFVPLMGIEWFEHKIKDSIAAPPSTSGCDPALVCTRNRIQSQHEVDRIEKQESLEKIRCLKRYFFWMWLPYYIFTFLLKLFGLPEPNTWGMTLFEFARPFVQLLGTSNSAVNPILFAYYSKEFQEILKTLFWRIFCCFKSCTSNSSVPSHYGGHTAGQNASVSNPASLRGNCSTEQSQAIPKSGGSTAKHNRSTSSGTDISLDALKITVEVTVQQKCGHNLL